MVENRVSSSADSTFQQAPRKANKQKDVHWDDLNHTKFFTYGIGFFLGIRATLFPFSLIKTRLQVQEGPPTTTLRAISQILRTQGPRGLYRGFGVTALGSIPSQSAYLLSYEFVKSKTANICSENLGFDDQKSGMFTPSLIDQRVLMSKILTYSFLASHHRWPTWWRSRISVLSNDCRSR